MRAHRRALRVRPTDRHGAARPALRSDEQPTPSLRALRTAAIAREASTIASYNQQRLGGETCSHGDGIRERNGKERLSAIDDGALFESARGPTLALRAADHPAASRRRG